MAVVKGEPVAPKCLMWVRSPQNVSECAQSGSFFKAAFCTRVCWANIWACMLQHATGTGRPERKEERLMRHSYHSSVVAAVVAVVGDVKKNKKQKKTLVMTNDLEGAQCVFPMRKNRMERTRSDTSRITTSADRWLKTAPHYFHPHLKSPRIPWWGRRGRSDTLFPTGAHKWRLREFHPSRTSLKPQSFGLPP